MKRSRCNRRLFLQRKVIQKLKEKVLLLSSWAKENWLSLVIIMVILMMFFLTLVMFSWLYAFWSNGLYGTKFEIGSCWQGLGTVVAGLGGVVGLAKASWTMQEIDSKYNSAEGEHPYKQAVKEIKEIKDAIK